MDRRRFLLVITATVGGYAVWSTGLPLKTRVSAASDHLYFTVVTNEPRTSSLLWAVEAGGIEVIDSVVKGRAHDLGYGQIEVEGFLIKKSDIAESVLGEYLQ